MSCRVIWSNLKTTCCLNFFSLEKCICPAVQICNGESFGSFWECQGKQPVTQKKTSFSYSVSFRRNGNVRPCRIGWPNVMVSIAIGETFLLMECINALSRGLLKRSCNLAWNDLLQLCGREFYYYACPRWLTLPYTPWFYTKKGATNIYDQLVMFMIKSTSMSFV